LLRYGLVQLERVALKRFAPESVKAENLLAFAEHLLRAVTDCVIISHNLGGCLRGDWK
jgi:hypothetical protein